MHVPSVKGTGSAKWLLCTALAGVGALLALGALGSGLATATFPGGNGKIAFSRDSFSSGHIFLRGRSGHVQQLTHGPATDSTPAFSANGKKVAFTRSPASSTAVFFDVYVINSDGTNLKRLTSGGAGSDPAFSPSGGKIAFSSAQTGNGDIYVMNVNGTKQRRLTTSTAVELSPEYSADGATIAFDRSRSNGTGGQIYLMDAKGNNKRRLTPKTGGPDHNPSFSPDGHKIVFDSTHNGNRDIWVMDADGRHRKRLTTSASMDAFPAFSPDGHKIVFASDRTGTEDIWIMDANGKHQHQLTSGPVSDTTPDWQAR